MTELNIIPECYVDTKLAEILGESSKKYNHQHGCGAVANKLKNQTREALGIVDEDKHKGPPPKFFSEFEILRSENNLLLKKHYNRDLYLIIICPEIEEWLMNNAIESGISPSEDPYFLPVDLKGLKKITKEKDINKNQGFYRLIKTLIRLEAPAISTLKHWILLFKTGMIQTLNNDQP